MSVDAFAPWLEYAIEAFGVDRCMFASNFPVDSMYGTFDELYEVFSAVTAGLDSESRLKLFAGTRSASIAARRSVHPQGTAASEDRSRRSRRPTSRRRDPQKPEVTIGGVQTWRCSRSTLRRGQSTDPCVSNPAEG